MGAMDQAARIDEINFPQFTAQLINDTFDALIDSNLRQMAAYTQLVETIGKTLTTYVNETKDDISADQILDFLASNMPAPVSDDEHNSAIYKGKTLDETEAAKLTQLVTVSDGTSPTYNSGDELTSTWDTLIEACAKRIAENKYTLLKEMVRQGILRLVVDRGLIETKLNFHSFQSSYDKETTSDYKRDKERKKSGGGFFALIGSYGSKTSRTKISVSTKKTTKTDYESTRVSIYGSVRIEFSTDYQALSGE